MRRLTYKFIVPLATLVAMAGVLFCGGPGAQQASPQHLVAAQAIVQPALRPAANLSDLLDPKTARNNLGITEVAVHLYATGGNGTVNSPWTGWDTAITWANNTTYRFVKGYYRLSAAWQLGNVRYARFCGDGGAVIQGTGTGDVIDFINGSGDNALMPFSTVFDGFEIDGMGTCARGIYVSGCHHNTISNCRIHDVTGVGLETAWNVCPTYTNIRVTDKDKLHDVVPVNGAIFGAINNQQTTAGTITNLIVEGCTGDGVILKNGATNYGPFGLVFNGGTSEGNGGRGLWVQSYAHGNTFLGYDCEANGGTYAVQIDGYSNRYAGDTYQVIKVSSTASRTAILGGSHGSLNNDCDGTINLGAVFADGYTGASAKVYRYGTGTNDVPIANAPDLFAWQAAANGEGFGTARTGDIALRTNATSGKRLLLGTTAQAAGNPSLIVGDKGFNVGAGRLTGAAFDIADALSPVFFYRAAELRGTTAYDVSGAALNGTYNGGVTFRAAGPLADGSPAVTLNGTSGYIAVPFNATLNVTGALTVAAWEKTSTTAADQAIVDRDDQGSNRCLQFKVNQSTGTVGVVVFTSGGAQVLNGVTNVADGNWHHVAMSMDGAGSLYIYVDGTADNAATIGAGAPVSRPVGCNVGRSLWAGGAAYFNGSLKDVIYAPTYCSPTATPTVPATAFAASH